eukprot:g611.t1
MMFPLASSNAAAIFRKSLRGCNTNITHTTGIDNIATFLQANVVILPEELAKSFYEFAIRNAKAIPLLDVTRVSTFESTLTKGVFDILQDVPRYNIYENGVKKEHVYPITNTAVSTSNLVAFLYGCSFSWENELQNKGITPRHVQHQKNVAMYRTSIPNQAHGPFAGNLVVSMRYVQENRVQDVIDITSKYPFAHGAPLTIADVIHDDNTNELATSASLGIPCLENPDYGDAVAPAKGDVPVFHACGVTAQLALDEAAKHSVDFAITHSPGCMFVTDALSTSIEDKPLHIPPFPT